MYRKNPIKLEKKYSDKYHSIMIKGQKKMGPWWPATMTGQQ
jgi:hypothetical protein